MDFYRVDSCLVANRPVRDFFAERKSGPLLAIVFLKRLQSLPLVGLSLLSARDITSKRLDPGEVVAYQEWSDCKPDWGREEIQKYRILHIRMVFEEVRIGVQFRLEGSSSSSPMRFYTFPKGYRNAYLALAGREIMSQSECPLAILDGDQVQSFRSQRTSLFEKQGSSGLGLTTTAGIASSSSNATNDRRSVGTKVDCRPGGDVNRTSANRGAGANTEGHQNRNYTNEQISDSGVEDRVSGQQRNAGRIGNVMGGFRGQIHSTASGSKKGNANRDFVTERAEEFFESGNVAEGRTRAPSENLLNKGGNLAGNSVDVLPAGQHATATFSKPLSSRDTAAPAEGTALPSEDVNEFALCTICHERGVQIIFLPCGHASICMECHGTYVAMERKKQKESRIFSKHATDDGVTCLLCRKKIEYIAMIWINGMTCLMCGCSNMDAVAGGKGGCGCLIGCYDKAVELLKQGGSCPWCSRPLVSIVKAYVGGVF